MIRLSAWCSSRKVQHVRGGIMEGNHSLSDTFLNCCGCHLPRGQSARSWNPSANEAMSWAGLAGRGLEAWCLAYISGTPWAGGRVLSWLVQNRDALRPGDLALESQYPEGGPLWLLSAPASLQRESCLYPGGRRLSLNCEPLDGGSCVLFTSVSVVTNECWVPNQTMHVWLLKLLSGEAGALADRSGLSSNCSIPVHLSLLVCFPLCVCNCSLL